MEIKEINKIKMHPRKTLGIRTINRELNYHFLATFWHQTTCKALTLKLQKILEIIQQEECQYVKSTKQHKSRNFKKKFLFC